MLIFRCFGFHFLFSLLTSNSIQHMAYRKLLPALRSIFTIFNVLTALTVMAWSQKGHDVTAAIAERHLTPAAAAAVDSIFSGRSLVYWSNWLDNASHTPEYAYSKTWHYRNVDANETYETARIAPDGDAITAIRYNLGILADSTASKPDKALALKMLVHIVGDIHQPMHMGRGTDLGGNTIKVKYFGRDTNLHSVWDSSLPESAHKWSYTEWVDQIDRATPVEQKLLMAGTIDDWAKQNVAIATQVYDFFPAGKNISYNDVAHWTPLIEDQFLKGGLRLARLLNETFDPTYDF